MKKTTLIKRSVVLSISLLIGLVTLAQFTPGVMYSGSRTVNLTTRNEIQTLLQENFAQGPPSEENGEGAWRISTQTTVTTSWPRASIIIANISYVPNMPFMAFVGDSALTDYFAGNESTQNGTAAYPYRIENKIFGGNLTATALSIQDSTVHVLIRNCIFFELGEGINLTAATNIQILNCTFHTVSTAIQLFNSNQISVHTSNFQNNQYGIKGSGIALHICNNRFYALTVADIFLNTQASNITSNDFQSGRTALNLTTGLTFGANITWNNISEYTTGISVQYGYYSIMNNVIVKCDWGVVSKLTDGSLITSNNFSTEYEYFSNVQNSSINVALDHNIINQAPQIVSDLTNYTGVYPGDEYRIEPDGVKGLISRIFYFNYSDDFSMNSIYSFPHLSMNYFAWKENSSKYDNYTSIDSRNSTYITNFPLNRDIKYNATDSIYIGKFWIRCTVSDGFKSVITLTILTIINDRPRIEVLNTSLVLPFNNRTSPDIPLLTYNPSTVRPNSFVFRVFDEMHSNYGTNLPQRYENRIFLNLTYPNGFIIKISDVAGYIWNRIYELRIPVNMTGTFRIDITLSDVYGAFSNYTYFLSVIDGYDYLQPVPSSPPDPFFPENWVWLLGIFGGSGAIGGICLGYLIFGKRRY